MGRARKLLIAASFALCSVPSPAFAVGATSMDFIDSFVRMGISALGLVVAVVLLLEALRVRDIAAGGAIAEKISYVVLAILCLSASALARWVQNFVGDFFSLEQIQLASEVLVIVAMVLLALYFHSVRSALRAFLKAMTGMQMLAQEMPQAGEDTDEKGA